MPNQPNRLELAFAGSIERRREAAGPLRGRDELYAFVNGLRGEGIPIEASAAVLDVDPVDFRRWLAGDTLIGCPSSVPRDTSAQTSTRPVTTRRPSKREPSDHLRRAFEAPVRQRAAELFPRPPRTPAGWFPLVRLLAGEGIPVDVSTAILGVDVEAYRSWLTDGRRQIGNAVGDSPNTGIRDAN